MNKNLKIVTFAVLFCLFGSALHAQIIGLGSKFDKKAMFQATFNAPLIFDKDKPYDVALGIDYTTGNKSVPSGLQVQVTGMIFLDEGRNKSHLLSAGVTTGYLFDFNTNFDNQFRVSPHLYLELFPVYIKAGYDYSMPLQKGTPFVSIGIVGGYMFRHFSIM